MTDSASPRPRRLEEQESGHALRYETHVDLSETNTSQTKIVLMTGRDKHVLEIGPATGFTTKVLQERGCRVTGVEIDPEAAAIGEQYCERMIVGNIEQLDLQAELDGQKFDVVMFSDVLEHLVNPTRVLEKMLPLLEPGGYVCASIPNFTHGAVRLMMLGGRFGYNEEGLLDRTHLRFFSRQGVEELFAGAGYAIEEWDSTEVDIFASELGVREQDYPRTLVEGLRESPDHLTYQFVVKASPAPATAVPKAPAEGATPLGKAMRPIWDLEVTAWERAQEIHRLTGQVQKEQHEVAALESRVAGIQHAYDLIVDRTNYKVWQKVVANLDRYAPWGTRRRKLILMPGYALRILMDRGPLGFAKHVLMFWRWVPKLFRRAVHHNDAGPKDRYKVWEQTHVLSPDLVKAMKRKQKTFVHQPVVSIVMPVYNPEPDWLKGAIDSVKEQIYPKWELCIADDGSTRQDVLDMLRSHEGTDDRIKIVLLERNVGIAAASAAAMELATGEFIGLLDHDDELKPHALYQIVKMINERPDIDYIYSDLDHKDLEGTLKDPFRKPDWSPDLFRSCNYVTHLSVYRKSVIEKVGGFRQGYDGSQDWDLTLRVTEQTDRIGHVRAPLYTWRQVEGSVAHSDDTKPWAHDAARKAIADSLARQGVKGWVDDGPYLGYYRVRYEIEGTPKISIVIPTRDRVDLLSRCIDSIQKLTTYPNYELVVVDNDSVEEETLAYFESFGGRVVKHPGEFNFSKIVNTGAAHCDADYLLLLNNDTEVITPDWIEAMLEHAQRPEVGAVGARLLFPDGRAQHEGVIVGPGDGLAGNVDFENYFGIGRCIHNPSAVTAACMLTRSEIFKGLGGFDEDLRVAYNDVDYCLRAGEKGFLIVYTPYATLYHHEAATRGYGTDETDNKSHPVADEAFFRERWRGYVDPFDPPSLKIDVPLVPTI